MFDIVYMTDAFVVVLCGVLGEWVVTVLRSCVNATLLRYTTLFGDQLGSACVLTVCQTQ
jgi:hypothetical protein